MDGVLVLDTIVNAEIGWNFFSISFLVCFCIAIILAITIVFSDYFCWGNTLILGLIALTMTGIMVIMLVLMLIFGYTDVTTQYRVMIDDTVKMTEFLQHYTIIRQEGLTYIVELVP
jgi:hypothetical protein